MLSRVADALYWLARYMERAEHAARVLEMTRGILIDVHEVDPSAADEHWRGTLLALGVPGERDLADVTFDENEPASIASAVSRARENARAVREVISSEMWENLNQAYWMVREAAAGDDRDGQLGVTLQSVVGAGFAWSGVTDGTMRRGEGWHFLRLGKYLERADRVARLVSVRARAADAGRGTATLDGGENVLWTTLLKSCSGLEAYRKVHPARVDPRRVVEFLLLDGEFPRSLRFSTQVALDTARRLGAELGGDAANRGVERAFGRLAARLEYTDVDEVRRRGVPAFLDDVLADLSAASMALQRTYFLH